MVPIIRGLRILAEQRGIQIGTCACIGPLQNDPDYASTLTREFNLLTPENALKFGPLCTEKQTYDFTAADGLIDFAERNDMKVRGHVLVWHCQLPVWLTKERFTKNELVTILTDHISTVVGRYAGRIAAWDVVNEAIDDNGELRETIWSKTIGPEYMDIAFRSARASDPDALLFYNDYGMEATARHEDGVYELLRDLLARSVPVDGVGLQMHLHIDDASNIGDLSGRLQRVSELGLHVHITELDVRMRVDSQPCAEQLATQARIYKEILRSYLAMTNCEAVVLWGFTDRHSWIPYFYPGEGAALILDEEYRKKPSYQAVADELGSWSNLAGN